MDANKKLGNNLRYYRKQRDMTLKEMAEKIEMSVGTYQKYETGNIKHVDIDIVNKFSNALDVPVPVLMGWAEEYEQLRSKIGKEALELASMDDENESEVVKQQNKISNYIWLAEKKKSQIKEFDIEVTQPPKEQDELTKRALELYKLYEEADPRIKAAVESLLKVTLKILLDS